MGTKIPRSEQTWNVSLGCTKVSVGCQNCYAEKMAFRLAAMGKWGYDKVMDGRKWNNTVCLQYDALDKPLHWRKPRKIFVNSMSDLFHESVPFEFIDKVMATMTMCHWHTYQVLTKRPERMAEYFGRPDYWTEILPSTIEAGKWYNKNVPEPMPGHIAFHAVGQEIRGPLPNLIGMVTAENQAMADLRIPYLLQCGFATTGVSVEPMLGPVDLWKYLLPYPVQDCFHKLRYDGSCNHADAMTPECHNNACPLVPDKVKAAPEINWVIIGPENGPGKRPFKIKWARNLVAQCDGAGVPVFIKPSNWLEWPDDLKSRQEYPKGK